MYATFIEIWSWFPTSVMINHPNTPNYPIIICGIKESSEQRNYETNIYLLIENLSSSKRYYFDFNHSWAHGL